ncbi:hypothetical protein H9P43_002012 [Blastocladiella emersonii ATCC 22665]|nr:hypothetical protein H9P43_002012 [Blastocladiella emersonii ATCC 22665]
MSTAPGHPRPASGARPSARRPSAPTTAARGRLPADLPHPSDAPKLPVAKGAVPANPPAVPAAGVTASAASAPTTSAAGGPPPAGGGSPRRPTVVTLQPTAQAIRPPENRIIDERIWADRVERELRAQRDYEQQWGFMLPLQKDRVTELRDRKAKEGLASSPFNVHSIMHPPTSTRVKPLAANGGTAGAAAPPKPLNQHIDLRLHRYQSVYKSAFTPTVFADARADTGRKPPPPAETGSGTGTAAAATLPNRYAALPNKKDAARVLRQFQGDWNPTPVSSTAFPTTSNCEYGWKWRGCNPLERFGSTSADLRRSHAIAGGRGSNGIQPTIPRDSRRT